MILLPDTAGGVQKRDKSKQAAWNALRKHVN